MKKNMLWYDNSLFNHLFFCFALRELLMLCPLNTTRIHVKCHDKVALRSSCHHWQGDRTSGLGASEIGAVIKVAGWVVVTRSLPTKCSRVLSSFALQYIACIVSDSV